MMHDLKIWPEHFQEIINGNKRFEIRSVEDRSFDDGDILRLAEWLPDEARYTRRLIIVEVTLVHAGMGMQKGFVCLAIKVHAWKDEGDNWQKWTVPHNNVYWQKQPVKKPVCWPNDDFDEIRKLLEPTPNLCKLRKPLPQNSSHIDKSNVAISAMELLLTAIIRAERLERHVAKLKRKLESHKRRSAKRIAAIGGH